MLTVKPTPETAAEWSAVEEFFRDLGSQRDRSRLKPVTDTIRRGFARNFLDESSGDGVQWDPLAPATVKDREEQGYPGESPILVRAGDYARSFTNDGDVDHVEEITPLSTGFRIEVGSRDYRADILEEGGFVDFNGSLVYVPARPVTILGDRHESDIGDALDAFFLSLEG